MFRRHKLTWSLVTFVALIVAARIAAPYYVLKYVNRTLDGLDGYSGHVEDVDLHIWRGAYEIEGVRIVKTTEKQPTPLLSVPRIDISVQWPELLHGAIVGEIDLYSPKLNIVAEKHEPEAEQQREERETKRVARGAESSWQTQVKELVPLKINRIGVHDGEIHYRDIHTKPQVDVYVQRFRGAVTNLTNSEDLSKTLAASASFRGLAMSTGKLAIEGELDPYAKLPTFRLDAKLEDLQLTQLNDFLQGYANVDAERGRLSVFTQVRAGNGRFRGYVKPLIRDLRIVRWKDEDEKLFGKLWETLVQAGSELFENHPGNQIATVIPMSGRLDNPDADIGKTVLYILRNAFVRALKSGFDVAGFSDNGALATSRSEED